MDELEKARAEGTMDHLVEEKLTDATNAAAKDILLKWGVDLAKELDEALDGIASVAEPSTHSVEPVSDWQRGAFGYKRSGSGFEIQIGAGASVRDGMLIADGVATVSDNPEMSVGVRDIKTGKEASFVYGYSLQPASKFISVNPSSLREKLAMQIRIMNS